MLLSAAQYTVACEKAVGQEASHALPRAARKRMTAWRNANAGCFWAVKLDVRDLGGQLDVTQRAPDGTLGNKVKDGQGRICRLLDVLLPLGPIHLLVSSTLEQVCSWTRSRKERFALAFRFCA